MSNKTSVFRNSILYTLGNLLLKAFSFFLIPLYTAYLSTEEYGIINLASGFYTLVASLIALGLQYAVIRYYADFKNDKEKVARMNGSIISFIILIGAGLLLISFIFKKAITQLFFAGIEFYPVVLLSILISLVSAVYTVYQDILKGMQNARMSVLLSYVFFFVLLIGNVLTVTVFRMGANGILLSTLVVYTVMMVIMFFDLFHRNLITLCIDHILLTEMLRYALPLVPHTIAYNLQNYATKAIISAKLSLSMLGIYGLASQFGGISDVVVNSVQSAFQPWMFDLLNKNEKSAKEDIKKTTYLLMWLYGLLFMGIGIFSQEAVLIMADKKYAEAWFFVPLIVATFSIKAPLYFYLNFLYYNKNKTKYIFTSTVIASIINIILTFILVPMIQVLGSIVADLIAILSRTIVTLYYTKEDTSGILSIGKIELLSLIPIAFIGIGLIPSLIYFRNSVSLINIAYKMFVTFIYIAIMIATNKKSMITLKNRILKR